jgi:hypothetical protein
MSEHVPPFDLAAAHRFFAADCFNRVWTLLDLPERTPEQDEEMLHLAIASLYHWTRREDCRPENRSVGYWQVSRVYAVLSQADNARRYAGRSRETSAETGPFYQGYALEALARAEAIAGRREAAEPYLAEAWHQAKAVPDPEEKAMLAADLEDIERLIAGLERLAGSG